MASFLTQWRVPRFHSEQQFDAATLVGYHAARNTPAWQLVEKIRNEFSRTVVGIAPTVTTDLALAGNLLKILISERIFPGGAYIDLTRTASPMRAFYPRLEAALEAFSLAKRHWKMHQKRSLTGSINCCGHL